MILVVTALLVSLWFLLLPSNSKYCTNYCPLDPPPPSPHHYSFITSPFTPVTHSTTHKTMLLTNYAIINESNIASNKILLTVQTNAAPSYSLHTKSLALTVSIYALLVFIAVLSAAMCQLLFLLFSVQQTLADIFTLGLRPWPLVTHCLTNDFPLSVCVVCSPLTGTGPLPAQYYYLFPLIYLYLFYVWIE
jgi:hypothetical protein